jgi:integrase
MVKVCEWCNKEIKHRQNYKPHVDKCFYRVELNVKKNDLDLLLGKPIPEAPKSEEAKMMELTHMELKEFLTDSYNKSMVLYKKFIQNAGKTPIDMINEMLIGDTTKKAYVIEWRLYNKWLTKHHKIISRESANEYLSQLKGKPSTKKKKQGMLQKLFKHLLDSTVMLNKSRERVSYKPKYAMTAEDTRKYLEEQKSLDPEYYLIQRFMLTYGLRVNTVGLLRIKHLEFMTNADGKIHLPDSKVKRARVEEVEPELKQLFIDHIHNTRGENFDENTFVFFKYGDRMNETLRAHKICVMVNWYIQNSKVLSLNSNYKFSSHMFRKTVAFNIYNEKLNELKAQARLAIGQSQGSRAIESYIYDN